MRRVRLIVTRCGINGLLSGRRRKARCNCAYRLFNQGYVVLWHLRWTSGRLSRLMFFSSLSLSSARLEFAFIWQANFVLNLIKSFDGHLPLSRTRKRTRRGKRGEGLK